MKTPSDTTDFGHLLEDLDDDMLSQVHKQTLVTNAVTTLSAAQ